MALVRTRYPSNYAVNPEVPGLASKRNKALLPLKKLITATGSLLVDSARGTQYNSFTAPSTNQEPVANSELFTQGDFKTFFLLSSFSTCNGESTLCFNTEEETTVNILQGTPVGSMPLTRCFISNYGYHQENHML